MQPILIMLPTGATGIELEWTQDGAIIRSFGVGADGLKFYMMEVVRPTVVAIPAKPARQQPEPHPHFGGVVLPPWQVCSDPGCWRAGQCLDTVHCDGNKTGP